MIATFSGVHAGTVPQMRQNAGIDDVTVDGESDLDGYESVLEHDSDDSQVTTGWDSQDDYFSSGEGMQGRDW